MTEIWLQGARTRNLQGIDVAFPAGAFVAITGVSGAGKTSLAISTLAAEGRRRFIETFPTQARRFLERLERPECDQIGPLPPAIIHPHSQRLPSRRSTVASLGEITGPLQQLFSTAGQIYCPDCQIPVLTFTPFSAAHYLARFKPGIRFQLTFSFERDADQVADLAAAELLEAGFQRVIVNNAVLELKVPLPPGWPAASEWQVIVDRLQTGRVSQERLIDSLELAFRRGLGNCSVYFHDTTLAEGHRGQLDGSEVTILRLHNQPICAKCQRHFPPLTPRYFSFFSPIGACPNCQGLGQQEQAICPECDGYRLKRDSLAVQCGSRSVRDVLKMTVQELLFKSEDWSSELNQDLDLLARTWIVQLRKRLQILKQLGLGHLALNRSGKTLSTGEAIRLALGATCSVELVNSLYVLEEPASGLHPRDIEQLKVVLRDLQIRGNTVVVTEHVKSIIQAADFVIDLGPGAGPDGGRLLNSGSPQSLVNAAHSVTSDYLFGRKRLESRTRRTGRGSLKLNGVTTRNLPGMNVEFPLGTLCVVTGVSGAGKTSLIRDTVWPAISQRFKIPLEAADQGSFDSLECDQVFHSVLYVDQNPAERSGRATVATACGIWPEIRTILAGTSEAKVRQFTSGTFSFHNASGGRCHQCEGRGTLAIDLQFLADLTIECPECGGTRFQRDVLEVKYRGHNVAEISNLTVAEAMVFFRGRSRLQRRLKGMKDVGLGFLQLGQPVVSLSGGEIQRLKLAERMMGKPSGPTLFLLDEPARGLHPADIQVLVSWFDDLLNEGHSIIAIEHRDELIQAADHVIELPTPAEW